MVNPYKEWPKSQGLLDREIDVRKFAIEQVLKHAHHLKMGTVIFTADKIAQYILRGREDKETDD